MALRLRRGTNAQRLGITFAEGELVYTTDTKKLYIGDASAAGGNLVSGMNNVVEDATPQLGGNLDLNGNNITGTGNINITGTLSIATGFLKTDIQGSVFADDSGILVDGIAGKLVLANNALGDLGNVATTAPTDGQVLKWNNSASQWQPQADSTGTQLLNTLTDVNAGSPQNLQALVWDSGTSKWIAGDVVQQGEFLDGDFRGSVFGDDSSLIVDGINNRVTADRLTATTALNVTGLSSLADVTLTRTSGSNFTFNRPTAVDPVQNDGLGFGRLLWQSTYNATATISALIKADTNALVLTHGTNYTTEPNHLVLKDGKLGLGTYTPTDNLHIVGTGKFTSSVQFGSFTIAQRNALTAANGMIIYNSEDNKFQGRANGAWVNLH